VGNDKRVLRNFTEISWNHDGDFSRKDAKAQSAAAFLRALLCALYVLARENILFSQAWLFEYELN